MSFTYLSHNLNDDTDQMIFKNSLDISQMGLEQSEKQYSSGTAMNIVSILCQ